ncbi:MAG: D-alanyl-D-alanine carboxypeptidase [Treponema sp.]|nr:D-alanyl-D-alanine carboxypeptidase [Treponema sp.]
MKNLVQRFTALSRKTKIIACVSTAFILALSAFFAGYARYMTGFTATVSAASAQEQLYLANFLNSMYPKQRTGVLKPLPYPVVSADLNVHAESAILIDAANGCVIYEKNADDVIPPASITKLFVMYIVFQEITAGRVTLDDVVPIPERSWAINMPRDASLMFLGQGQNVTLRELLTGLAVASGNDAALAVAAYISGSTEAFVARMNEEAQKLGLTHTHFEEPSGYSENNLTTPRELAAFARIYIQNYPQALSEFHAQREIRYPLAANLPVWEKDKGDSAAVRQFNTNGLLRTLEGCDGLKTGFIYESGFNLALTAERNGVRFISVTMRGPGASTAGKNFREVDGTTIMEWAFARFADYNPAKHIASSYQVPVVGAKGHFVRLIPAWQNVLTVPHLIGETPSIDAEAVTATVSIPRFLTDSTKAGNAYGKIIYKLGDTVLETVPLVADRSLEQAGLLGHVYGKMAQSRL